MTPVYYPDNSDLFNVQYFYQTNIVPFPRNGKFCYIVRKTQQKLFNHFVHFHNSINDLNFEFGFESYKKQVLQGGRDVKCPWSIAAMFLTFCSAGFLLKASPHKGIIVNYWRGNQYDSETVYL